MIPKIVVFFSLLVMAILVTNPINFAAFYIFFRPIVQPFGKAKLTLIGNIPLTAVYPIFLICYYGIICFLKKSYTLIAPNIIPLYGLLYFSIFSFLNTTDYMLSFGHLLKIVTATFFYLLIYHSINTEKDAKKILYVFMVSGIIPMLYGYYQFVTGTGGSDFPGAPPRVSSFFGYNEYGIFLCILMSCNLMLILLEKKRVNKVFLLILLASMITSSILAMNRGSWITYSIALILAYIPYRKKIKIRWFLIAGLLITILFSDIIITRFMQLKQTTTWGLSGNTLLGRYNFWLKLMTLLDVHPLTGFGLGTARIVSYKYFKINHVPHNDYLTLALEVGIVGAFFYIFFLCKILVRHIQMVYDKTDWFINYPVLVLIIYWCVLSFAQNIMYDMVTLPMFFAVIAISQKWNKLSQK